MKTPYDEQITQAEQDGGPAVYGNLQANGLRQVREGYINALESVELNWRYAMQFVEKYRFWPQPCGDPMTSKMKCLDCGNMAYDKRLILHTDDCPYLRFKLFQDMILGRGTL